MRAPSFRSLIVLSWVGTTAAHAVAELQNEAISLEVRMAIDNVFISPWLELDAAAHGVFVAMLAIFFSLLLANLAGAFGMLFYRRWGRSLSLWTTASLLFGGVTLLLFGLSTGPHVHFGWEGWLTSVSCLSWGAALSLAYWSPLAARFERPAVPSDPGQAVA